MLIGALIAPSAVSALDMPAGQPWRALQIFMSGEGAEGAGRIGTG